MSQANSLLLFSFDDFDDEIVDLLKVYLVNKTPDAYSFTYDQDNLGDKEMAFKNTILPFQDFYLHDIDFADISNNPNLKFSFQLIQSIKGKAKEAPYAVKLKAKQVFQKIEDLKKLNLPAINYPLFTEYPNLDIKEVPEAIGILASPNDRPEAKQNANEIKSTVDLHIEKLTDSWKDMSNYEILMLQVNEFEKCYDAAVRSYQRSLIIIHGVGSGRLRDFIHEELKTKREVSSFINQYDPRFGYGATEIYFK